MGSMSETLSFVPAREQEQARGSSAPQERDDWLVETRTVGPSVLLSLRPPTAARQARCASPAQESIAAPNGTFSVARRHPLASEPKVLKDFLGEHGQVGQSGHHSMPGRK